MTRFTLTLSLTGIWLMAGCGARTSDDDLLLGGSASVGGTSAGGDSFGDGGSATGGNATGGRSTGGQASGGSGAGGTPAVSCCFSTEGPGCDDTEVEQCVCALDGFCCEQSWDQACVDEAENFCNADCTLPPTGGTGGVSTGGTGGVSTGGVSSGGTSSGGTGGVIPGNCCEAHGGNGCQNPTVQACVCDIDPFCCDTNWDAICVNRVTNDCGVECRDPGTGGTGGTGGAGGTGGNPGGGTGGVVNQCEEIFDDDCGSCMCNNCFDELNSCLGDFGCLAVVNCIGETGCFGFDCYQPSTCQGVIDLFGGLASASTQNALALGLCTATSGCECD